MPTEFDVELEQRLPHYCAIDSRSDAASSSQPSREIQLSMSRLSVSGLEAMGAQDVHLTAYGMVLATVPGTVDGPVKGARAGGYRTAVQCSRGKPGEARADYLRDNAVVSQHRVLVGEKHGTSGTGAGRICRFRVDAGAHPRGAPMARGLRRRGYYARMCMLACRKFMDRLNGYRCRIWRWRQKWPWRCGSGWCAD